MTTTGLTACLVFAALLVAHHLGDHWIQTHHQAITKGQRTRAGQWACARHVATYTLATTGAVLLVTALPLGADVSGWGLLAGQAWSAVTHYVIDRRWTLALLADLVGKRAYHDLGETRGYRVHAYATRPTGVGARHALVEPELVQLDNPPATTGATSLDQAAHWAMLGVAALWTALL
ncbi:hypothetical protein JOF41_007331 [Saccharothrix coeruleofusca]|uniref:DUF3307 domain-containing protein n=1 Tax=Saccharothrix coeruleofusca TaxID=33919 RepID=UPI001AE83E9E|nr:DUF3307 domain-containing protein [Saccharothrix coeruleofusca]MBP2341077.1 hypothetical protein [Saccharothrix coeruleofusca]